MKNTMKSKNESGVGSGDLLSTRLPKTQQELYDAMKAGTICHYQPYMGRLNPSAYYFRSDTMKRCTAAAEALLKRGLLEVYAKDWRGHKLRVLANAEMSHEHKTSDAGSLQAPRVLVGSGDLLGQFL